MNLRCALTLIEVQAHILESIRCIAENIARAARVPKDLLPVMTVRDEHFPALYNDPDLVRSSVQAMSEVLGADNLVEIPPTAAGEDFSLLGRTRHKVPIFLFRVGSAQPGTDPKKRPGLHSPLFHPVPEPTIYTGVVVMCAAVLKLMAK